MDHNAVCHIVIQHAVIHIALMPTLRAGEVKDRPVDELHLCFGINICIQALPNDKVAHFAALWASNRLGSFHRHNNNPPYMIASLGT